MILYGLPWVSGLRLPLHDSTDPIVLQKHTGANPTEKVPLDS